MDEYINNLFCSSSWENGTANPTLGSSNIPVGGVEDSTLLSLSFTGGGNVRSHGQEFEYNRSFKDLQPWPLPSVMGQEIAGEFGGQEIAGEFGWKNFLDININEDTEKYSMSSFTIGPAATNGVSFLPQATSVTATSVCNGTGKPRVRARRGQATDPHSIAERLRREKIAERMKNLQELVPNSRKVDKASMLYEIIEYVKFLQLQVKVLSISRLGAAGAVIPLITRGQAEGSKSMSLSPSVGPGVDISPSADQIALEQEVLELMETNMTMAIQHLQSKGLCLMPLALADAISSVKTSSPGFDNGYKKIGCCDLVHSSSSSSIISGIETCWRSCDGNNVAEQLEK